MNDDTTNLLEPPQGLKRRALRERRACLACRPPPIRSPSRCTSN